jgi:NTP pyrophosphatase (non-canonical NTP hydrolase)
MNLKEISEKLGRVSDIYAQKFEIRRDDDWFVLKIQEELGELSSAHLKLTQRARIGSETKNDLEQNLKDEIADVIALTLLFAKHKGIDVEQALENKWFKYLR